MDEKTDCKILTDKDSQYIIDMWRMPPMALPQRRQLASSLLACCFAREGGEAHGVHHHYFHFDFAARARNKKRLAAPFPNGSASLIVGGR